jgi:hypothetical protein
MGYGLAAVKRGTPGAVSLREARRIVEAQGMSGQQAVTP